MNTQLSTNPPAAPTFDLTLTDMTQDQVNYLWAMMIRVAGNWGASLDLATSVAKGLAESVSITYTGQVLTNSSTIRSIRPSRSNEDCPF